MFRDLSALPGWNQHAAQREEEGFISTLTLLKDYFRTCSNMLSWIIYPAEPRHWVLNISPMLLPHCGEKCTLVQKKFLRKQRCLQQNKCNARWLTWDLNWGLRLSLNYRWTLRVNHRKVYMLLFPSGVVAYLLVTDASGWKVTGESYSWHLKKTLF